MAELVSQTEFAKRVGVSRQRIGKLVKRGIIILVDNKVDVDQAVAAIDQTHDPARQHKMNTEAAGASASAKPPAEEKTGTVASARAVLENFRARSAKLKYEKDAGKVVDRGIVRRHAFAEGRAVRDAFMSLGGRLRDRLAGEDDPIEIHKLLDAEVAKVLRELADGKRTDLVDDLGLE